MNASVGPPEVDAGHCRWNLAALHGVEVADAFLDAWRRPSSRTAHDPYYDAVTLLDANLATFDGNAWRAAGRPDLTREVVRARLDIYGVSLARRLAK